jgi:hypothetical protein
MSFMQHMLLHQCRIVANAEYVAVAMLRKRTRRAHEQDETHSQQHVSQVKRSRFAIACASCDSANAKRYDVLAKMRLDDPDAAIAHHTPNSSLESRASHPIHPWRATRCPRSILGGPRAADVVPRGRLFCTTGSVVHGDPNRPATVLVTLGLQCRVLGGCSRSAWSPGSR